VNGLRSSLRVPGFTPLVGTYSLTGVTDWLAAVALSIYVFDETGSALATTALFLAAKFLPALLVPPLTAHLDGRPVVRVLVLVFLVEAATLGLLAATTEVFLLPLVLAFALLDGTLAGVARAATRAATVAALEPAGLLREGNAVLNIGGNAGMLLGPAGAAGLVAAVGVGPTLAATAVAFLGLAVLSTRAHVATAVEREVAPWQEGLREAYDHVRGRPTLVALLGGQAGVLLLVSMTEPVDVVFAKDTLDAGDAGLGALLTSWGGGVVLGSLLYARMLERRLGALIAAATALVAVAYLGLALAPTLLLACVASVIGGVGNGVQWVAVVTAIQEATEEAFQARVAGLFEAVAFGAPGLGFMLGGGIAALVSPRATFAVAGIGVAVLVVGAVVVMRMPRARIAVGREPVAAEPLPEPVG